MLLERLPHDFVLRELGLGLAPTDALRSAYAELAKRAPDAAIAAMRCTTSRKRHLNLTGSG